MPKKKKIPAAVRNIVWLKYIPDKNNARCFCCKLETITNANWHCGHIISEKKGGKIHVDNLRPICGGCNSSMGATNMYDFMKKYGFDTIENNNKMKKTKNTKKKLSEKQLVHLANMRAKAKKNRERKKSQKIAKELEKNEKEKHDKIVLEEKERSQSAYDTTSSDLLSLFSAQCSTGEFTGRKWGHLEAMGFPKVNPRHGDTNILNNSFPKKIDHHPNYPNYFNTGNRFF